MQMVTCDKCKKPIDHEHHFRIFDGVVEHNYCDDPFGNKCIDMKKTLPAFAYESPQKKVV